MSKFLNIYFDDKTPMEVVQKHFIYSSLWIFNVLVFLFRIDLSVLNVNQEFTNALKILLPFILIVLNVVVISKQKWYYNLALLFYPVLIVFWFIPKKLLKFGKVYLFLYYLASVFMVLKNFKKSAIYFVIGFSLIILLITTNDIYIRSIALIFFTYAFIKLLVNYVAGTYEKASDEYSNKPLNTTGWDKINLAESIEKQKQDEKLNEEEIKKKKIETILIYNFGLQYLIENINGNRGKRAFIIVWFFQYIQYYLITLFFFTFANYELYRIDPNNFHVIGDVNILDFLYYTLKSIAFSGIDDIKPASLWTKLAETSTFLILSVYFLIITLSSFFSLSISDYSKEMERVVIVARRENENLIKHLETKYQMDVSKATSEILNINQSIEKLAKILRRLI
jgi:hypothetical protein